jgi:hypothetical protein
MTPARRESPVVAWTLLAAGIVSVLYAWQIRQPQTSSDFTILYTSARNPPERMYQPPSGARVNMNPPQFQLALAPLAALPLPVASTVFRAVSLVSAILCVWWLARSSRDRWTAGDVGALLTWAPMASMLSLNQVTWLLWPLLIFAWTSWRRDRWTAGAVSFGVAMSVKPFLGIVALWLLATRRWRALTVAIAAAACAFAAGLLAYGAGPYRAWIVALGREQWSWAPMNASVAGWLARIALADGTPGTTPTPTWVSAAALLLSIAIIVAAIVRVRHCGVERSWPLLVTSALLASPLGWIYYIWWIVAVSRPIEILMMSPLLWVPWAYVPAHAPDRLVAGTLGSVYFWGLFLLWAQQIRSGYTLPESGAPGTGSAGSGQYTRDR